MAVQPNEGRESNENGMIKKNLNAKESDLEGRIVMSHTSCDSKEKKVQ